MVFRSLLLFSFCLLFSACSLKHPEVLNSISSYQQVLIVSSIKPGSSYGFLSAWEKKSRWQKVLATRVVLGRTGIAVIDAKREGDGHTPAGRFSIQRAFGYEERIQTKLDYRQATHDDFWVDDPASAQYNQWVDGKPQANSFEEMRRKDHLYSLGAVIEYNTDPIVPGKGSAIFLHIWRAYHKPTAGCVAVSSRQMRKLLAWLDKNKDPVIIIGDK